MRTVRTKEAKLINWAIPEQKVTHDELISAIKKSELEPFYSVQESVQHFEKWLKLREKK